MQLQFTPALAESLVTVAAICAVLTWVVVETDIVAGGVGVVEIDTTMAGCVGAVMVTGAWAFFVESVTEVATIMTLPPLGTAPGATYIVLAPLAVEVGVNVPHAPVGVQVQFTPALALSFVTVADTPTLSPTVIDWGGRAEKFTEIDWGPVPPPPPALLPPPPPQALSKVRLRMKRGASFLFIRVST